MAKRRRQRGTWFPNLGTEGPEQDPDDDDMGRWLDIPLFPSGGNGQQSNTVIIDVTFDNPIEDEALSQTNQRSSLADILGSEYILKRIVGKCFVGLDQIAVSTASLGAVVTAGFFVARAEDSSSESPDNPQPIGTETQQETRENYSPAAVSTVREPWIWRRRWILGNFGAKGLGTSPAQGVFPRNNCEGYGSVMDGPHIDAHTIRRVSQDDRLWFAVSGRNLGADWANPFESVDIIASVHAKVHLDYRLYGSLIKAKNRGAF